MSDNQNRLGDKWVFITRAKVQKLHWEKQIYWNRFPASLILTHKSASAITAPQALSKHGGLRHNCFFPSNTCAGYGQRFSEQACLCFPGHWAVPCQCDTGLWRGVDFIGTCGWSHLSLHRMFQLPWEMVTASRSHCGGEPMEGSSP